MVFIVGLTGGIGSGKTSVAKLFATWGATVVDADQIAHNLLAPGSKALTQVAKRFGADRPHRPRKHHPPPNRRPSLEPANPS